MMFIFMLSILVLFTKLEVQGYPDQTSVSDHENTFRYGPVDFGRRGPPRHISPYIHPEQANIQLGYDLIKIDRDLILLNGAVGKTNRRASKLVDLLDEAKDELGKLPDNSRDQCTAKTIPLTFQALKNAYSELGAEYNILTMQLSELNKASPTDAQAIELSRRLDDQIEDLVSRRDALSAEVAPVFAEVPEFYAALAAVFLQETNIGALIKLINEKNVFNLESKLEPKFGCDSISNELNAQFANVVELNSLVKRVQYMVDGLLVDRQQSPGSTISYPETIINPLVEQINSKINELESVTVILNEGFLLHELMRASTALVLAVLNEQIETEARMSSDDVEIIRVDLLRSPSFTTHDSLVQIVQLSIMIQMTEAFIQRLQIVANEESAIEMINGIIGLATNTIQNTFQDKEFTYPAKDGFIPTDFATANSMVNFKIDELNQQITKWNTQHFLQIEVDLEKSFGIVFLPTV